MTSPLFAFAVAHGEPIRYHGAWRYQRQMDPDGGSWSMQQVYSVGVGHQPTANTRITGNVRYSDALQDDGQRVNQLHPSLQLDLDGPGFALSLGGSETRRDSRWEGELRTRDWTASLNSVLQGYPQLSLRAAGTSSANRDGSRPTDQQSRTLGAALEQAFPLGRALYDFHWDRSENHRTDTESDSKRHTGRLQLNHAAFGRRLRLSASQLVSYAEHAVTVATTPGVGFWVPLVTPQGLAGEDSTPQTDPLDPLPALVDGDVEASSGFILSAGDHANLALTSEYQEVDRILLYLLVDMDQLDVSAWEWSVYTSDDGQFWIPRGPLGQPELTPGGGITELAFSLPAQVPTSRYLKLVVVPAESLHTPVAVTELAAVAERVADAPRETTTHSLFREETQANLQLQPWTGVQFGYAYRRSRSTASNTPENRTDSHTVHGNWWAAEQLSLSGSVGQTRERVAGHAAQTLRSLSLGAQSSPLTALDLSAGYSASESRQGSARNGRSDSVYGHLGAQIYPDLSANLDANWAKSQTRNRSGATESFNASLGGIARFTPALQTNVRYESSWGNRSDQARRLVAGASYRPSAYLYLTLNAQRDFEAAETPVNTRFNCKLSERVQVGGGAAGDVGNVGVRRYDGFLDWSLGRRASLRAVGNVEEGDGPARWSTFVGCNFHP